MWPSCSPSLDPMWSSSARCNNTLSTMSLCTVSNDAYEGKAPPSEETEGLQGPNIIRHLAKLKRTPGVIDALERTLEVDKGLDVPLVSALLLAVDQVGRHHLPLPRRPDTTRPAASARTSQAPEPLVCAPIHTPPIHSPPIHSPPRFSPPRFSPPRSTPPRSSPPRFSPPRFSPPRSSPPRSSPPRFSPPRSPARLPPAPLPLPPPPLSPSPPPPLLPRPSPRRHSLPLLLPCTALPPPLPSPRHVLLLPPLPLPPS